MKLKHIFLGLALCSATIASAELRTYPEGNPGMYHNDDYTVKVRTIGGEWRNLYEYRVQVDMDKPQDATMVQFDMDEPVEVFVKKNNGDFSAVDIRPLKNDIKYERGRNWIEFRLDEPAFLTRTLWSSILLVFCMSTSEIIRGSPSGTAQTIITTARETASTTFMIISGIGCAKYPAAPPSNTRIACAR